MRLSSFEPFKEDGVAFSLFALPSVERSRTSFEMKADNG